jgi:hypothetical protein
VLPIWAASGITLCGQVLLELGDIQMLEQSRRERGELVAELLAKLKIRPVVTRPESWPAEDLDLILARVDCPDHAAELGVDEYDQILRASSVVWKSLLLFVTRTQYPFGIRVFWVDPSRRAAFGCRLDNGEMRLISPILAQLAYRGEVVLRRELGNAELPHSRREGD